MRSLNQSRRERSSADDLQGSMTGRPGTTTLNQCCCNTGRPPRTGGTSLRPSWRFILSNAVNSFARDRSLRSPSLTKYRLCGTAFIVIATSAQGIALSMRFFHHATATNTKRTRFASLENASVHTQFHVPREEFQTELASNDTHNWSAACPAHARLDEACMFACKPSAPMFPFKALPARWLQHPPVHAEPSISSRLA